MTPTPPPAPFPASPVSRLVPLLFAFAGPSGSFRRLLLTVAGLGVVALNKKLGLEMDFNTQCLVVGGVITIVTASTTKEISVARAQANVQVAMHNANAAASEAEAAAAAPGAAS